MKGLKEGLAAATAALTMAGAADVRAEEEISIISDPDVRETVCRMLADDSERTENDRLWMLGLTPAPVSMDALNTEVYVNCVTKSTPPNPTPAEKRQEKCTEVGDKVRSFTQRILFETPNAAHINIAANSAATAAEDRCLADEEQAARARCDEEGKHGTDAYSMMMDHHMGPDRDRTGEKLAWDIVSACLANEGLKP